MEWARDWSFQRWINCIDWWERIGQINSMITWASIASIGERFPKGQLLEEWKTNGVRFVKNGRTHQELPQKIELFSGFSRSRC